MLPGWNLTISNETLLSFSVQWTNLTALLGSQVEHFIVLLKWNRNNDSNVFHKIVNGRESRTEMTGLLSSSQYTVEVFGTDKMGQPYKTLEVRARTLNGKKNCFVRFYFHSAWFYQRDLLLGMPVQVPCTHALSVTALHKRNTPRF